MFLSTTKGWDSSDTVMSGTLLENRAESGVRWGQKRPEPVEPGPLSLYGWRSKGSPTSTPSPDPPPWSRLLLHWGCLFWGQAPLNGPISPNFGELPFHALC